MARKLAVVLAVLAVGGGATFWLMRRPSPPPDPGIALSLARDRAARVSSLKYSVALRIPAARTERVHGRLAAAFTLADASAPLAFDFALPADRLLAVVANGRSIEPRTENGHIVIPRGRLIRGANTIEFEFLAGEEPLNRHEDFLYTLFVPARASRSMPCFDQPDLKARWTLRLDVPGDWTAVSNGRESGRMAGPAGTLFTFEETEPLPTYLFAFAAGKFTVDEQEVKGRRFRMFHRETDAARMARNRDAIFDLHGRALEWLEAYTAIPYAFGKFDFVLIPSFQFSGMEHPGAVYYNANSLLLDETATQNQALARASVIAHETAHMWFGDLVTMRWFNDVWMKEVFANLMAAKIVNPSFPDVNHDLRFLFQHVPGAYEVDRTEGANPIRQELANLDEAGSLYGAIIYQKAPVVMRQLEQMVGVDVFRDGLREYLKANAFGNADWPDLIARLDRRTPADLAAWSHAWVEEAGRPTIRTALEIERGVVTRLAFAVEDRRGRRLNWSQQLQVLVMSSGGRVQAFDVTLDGPETVVAGATGLAAPQWVLPVGRGDGYGFFDVDPATRDYLATDLHRIADPLTRGAALVVAWEAMLEKRMTPAALLKELLAAIPGERDELNLQQMLDYARTAYWRFTPADDRPRIAPDLERVLRTGLGRSSSTSLKAAWFSALRSVAITPSTVAWLEDLWRRRVRIPGLPLAEVDESDLASDLAIREVAASEEILEIQFTRFANPDRKARFAFVRPALSRDPVVRDRFFESMRDPANRTREAWVLDAMRYLHHPLRAAASKKHVRPALDLVREIQRTGDIFFPKRWADATLGGYQSVQTAAEVRAFINSLPPDYPPRLRWVLLTAADPLFRAAEQQQQESQ
jgi:aminopeptidase N